MIDDDAARVEVEADPRAIQHEQEAVGGAVQGGGVHAHVAQVVEEVRQAVTSSGERNLHFDPRIGPGRPRTYRDHFELRVAILVAEALAGTPYHVF